MWRFILFVAFLAVLVPAVGATASVGATVVKEDPLTREELDIAKTLRCTVCQNQSVADSQADLAKDMRALIRQQLRAGKSRKEIVDYFVSRYGDYVLLKPPFDAAGAVVWIAPLFLTLVLGLSGWFVIRRRNRAPAPPAPQLTEEDLARVRAARQQD